MNADPNRTTTHAPEASTADPALGTTQNPGTIPEGTRTDLRDTKPPQPAGFVVPGYEVRGELARGGMGLVLAAHDPVLDREVAIKVLLPGRHPENAAARFVTESKITARLPHPGIPPVHQLGTLPDGSPFLAMKLIRGKTLAALLRERPNPGAELPRWVQVFEQICQTVGFAHAQQIIHRDLKPSNVMVGGFGEVQVMDWGLAKETRNAERGVRNESQVPVAQHSALSTQHSDATAAGAVLGTPAYMPPEQARGEKVDSRADVFALGGILCTILTGSSPYMGSSAPAILARAAKADLSSAFEWLDACTADAELVALCKWCLSPAPDDRPADGKAVAEAVAAYRTGVEDRLRQAETERAAAAAEAREQRKRRKVQLALAAAVLGLVVGGGAFAWWEDHQRSARRNAQLRVEAERASQEQTTRASVNGGLALAGELRRQFRFTEADTILTDAAKQLDTGLADDLRPAVAQARDDLAFAVELDQIRAKKSTWIPEPDGKGRIDTTGAPPAYRAAFLAHGFDIAEDDPATVATRLAASGIWKELVAALDDWSVYEPNEALRYRVMEVARRSEPGPWTDRFRDPAIRADRVAFARLTGEAQRANVSPAAMAAVVELLRQRRVVAPGVYADAAARSPGDFDLMIALGNTYLNRSPAMAVVYFSAARSIRPDSLVAAINLGSAYSRAKQHDGAIAAARSVVRMAPEFITGHGNLAVAYYDAGKLPEAETAVREAIRLGHHDARIHGILGLVLQARGDLRGATTAFKEAVRREPNYYQAHINLSAMLHRLGDKDGSLSSAREAVRLAEATVGGGPRERDPSATAAAYTNLAQALVEKRLFDEAIAACRIASTLDPSMGLPHTNLGTALYELGQFDEAEAAHRLALQVEPGLPEGHYNLGILMARRKDYRGAEAEFREAIRLDPKQAKAYTNLGVALHYQGDLEGAAAAYREATRIQVYNATAFYNLGGALHESGDLDGAVVAGREAVRLEPNRAQHHYQLGMALLGKGDWAAGADVLKEAVRLDPNSIDSLGALGHALQAQAKFAEALVYFKLADKAAPVAKLPARRYPTAEWVKECEELVEADARLSDFLARKIKAQGTAELANFAMICAVYRQRYAEAARFYDTAFKDDDKLMKTLQHRRLFNAARAAVRAGFGEGINPPQEVARVGFRRKGYDWLKLELDVRQRFVKTDPSTIRGTHQMMKTWLTEPAFAGVRHPFRLAALPAEEVKDWLAFWAEVRRLHDLTAPPEIAPRPREVKRKDAS